MMFLNVVRIGRNILTDFDKIWYWGIYVKLHFEFFQYISHY